MVANKKTVANNRKYNEKHYDRVEFMVKKGDKDKIKEHVTKHYPGQSVNFFIRKKLREDIPELRE